MIPKFTFDDREFGRAAALVEKETGRSARDSINRAGLYVIIGGKGFKGAMQLTPKADRSAIKSIPYEKVAAFVAKVLRSRGVIVGRRKGDRASETRDAQGRFLKGSGKISFASGAISGGEFKTLVQNEIKRRIRAIGYTAFVGWNNAAKAFGGRGLKGVTESVKKLARFGYGKKAVSTMVPVATLTNTAPMAENIGLTPLQMAITNVARDLVEYVNKKLNNTFKKVQP